MVSSEYGVFYKQSFYRGNPIQNIHNNNTLLTHSFIQNQNNAKYGEKIQSFHHRISRRTEHHCRTVPRCRINISSFVSDVRKVCSEHVESEMRLPEIR